jgi:hypothetical protein
LLLVMPTLTNSVFENAGNWRVRVDLTLASPSQVHCSIPTRVRLQRVNCRRQTMSALAAAFAESGHGGLIPKITPNTARAR